MRAGERAWTILAESRARRLLEAIERALGRRFSFVDFGEVDERGVAIAFVGDEDAGASEAGEDDFVSS